MNATVTVTYHFNHYSSLDDYSKFERLMKENGYSDKDLYNRVYIEEFIYNMRSQELEDNADDIDIDIDITFDD